MAIRYSGDVEIRMVRRGRTIVALLRSPTKRLGTTLRFEREPTSEDYDRIARLVLYRAKRKHPGLPVEVYRGGRIHIRRGFVSPCPKDIT